MINKGKGFPKRDYWNAVGGVQPLMPKPFAEAAGFMAFSMGI